MTRIDMKTLQELQTEARQTYHTAYIRGELHIEAVHGNHVPFRAMDELLDSLISIAYLAGKETGYAESNLKAVEVLHTLAMKTFDTKALDIIEAVQKKLLTLPEQAKSL